MSKRDYALLDEAGLNISDAATLFGRSRQALYAGLKNDDEDYFSPRDVMTILNNARGRDLTRLDDLLRFIEANYPDSNCELPARIGHEQLKVLIAGVQHVLMCTNFNTDHLLPNAAFAKILRHVLATTPERLRLVVPAEWVLQHLRQNGITPSPDQVTIGGEAAERAAFVATEDAMGRHRAFVFGRMGIEEMFPYEANCLWTFALGATNGEASVDMIGKRA